MYLQVSYGFNKTFRERHRTTAFSKSRFLSRKASRKVELSLCAVGDVGGKRYS